MEPKPPVLAALDKLPPPVLAEEALAADVPVKLAAEVLDWTEACEVTRLLVPDWVPLPIVPVMETPLVVEVVRPPAPEQEEQAKATIHRGVLMIHTLRGQSRVLANRRRHARLDLPPRRSRDR